MGLMRFHTPQRERVTREAVERSYIAGLDCVPTPARKSWDGEGALRLEREIDESGCLHIPWEVDGYGTLLLSTASLMERVRPYQLPVELARGTVNRLRTKASVWKLAGLEVTAEWSSELDSTVKTFTRAATSQDQPAVSARLAETAIRQALDAMASLAQQYSSQVLESRHRSAGELTTLLAGNLGGSAMPENLEPMFVAAFNAAVIPFNWRDAEPESERYDWGVTDRQLKLCLRHRLKALGGPLMRLDRNSLPDWVADRCRDFDWLSGRMTRYIAETVKRHKGQVQLWHCSAAANVAAGLPLSDEQRLRLAVQAIETTRRCDPRTPVIVSFDQPWGEYMVETPFALPPMHFAEMLVRAELGLAGIGLELNLGYWPDGSLPRDLLEIGQLIDQWSQLGLPLIPVISIPSGCDADPLASQATARPVRSVAGDCPSMDGQKRLIEQLLPMLTAKQSVQAIVWNQVFDSADHRFAHGGLFDASSRPKPSLTSVIGLRRDHLQ
jgi:hypothetical protein